MYNYLIQVIIVCDYMVMLLKLLLCIKYFIFLITFSKSKYYLYKDKISTVI